MLPADWLRPFEGRFRREAPLAPWTTWRIGGPAELLLEPESIDDLAEMTRALWRSGVPVRLLGGGSNLLISDRGVRGAVLSLRKLRAVTREGNGLVVEAGAHLHWVVRHAARAGLSGAEPLAGIPALLPLPRQLRRRAHRGARQAGAHAGGTRERPCAHARDREGTARHPARMDRQRRLRVQEPRGGFGRPADRQRRLQGAA